MLILVALIFIAFGIAIKYGKMYFLIAGFNTMPKEKQQQYDIKGIASVFRNAMFGMALILILGHLLSKIISHENIEVYVLFAALIVGLPYLLVVSNSSKYKIK